MIKLIKKLFSTPYECCMELHNQFGCYISIIHPSYDSIDGFRKFFNENHFLIAHNMFDETWDDKIKLEEIFKKLILIYDFDSKDEDIVIVYKNHNKVYLPNNKFVCLSSRSIFVYNKKKINIFF